MKMRRCIYVCAPLTDMSKDLGKKNVAHHAWLLFVPVIVFRCSSGKPDQRGMPGAKSWVRSTNCLLPMISCRSTREISGNGSRAKTRIGPAQNALLKIATASPRLRSEVFTSMLLNDCAKGSEQLSITYNKKRLPCGNCGLQPPAPSLFTFFLPESCDGKRQRMPCYWRHEDEEFV